MDNTVAAVIVTYNRKQLLKECLSNLLRQSYSNLDVLVVDNDSTDGTTELVHRFTDKRVKYINTGKNLGGAGGFQFGIREAVKRGYDYLWLMDDDTMPTETALKSLMDFAKAHPNFGFLSSKVLWKDKSICNMNIPKVSINRKLQNFDGDPSQILMASFVSFFVPSKVVKKVGLPIKEFFIWGDDIEYSRRISRQLDCYFVPDSVVIHKSASNNGSNIATDSIDRLNRYNYAYRNEVYIYRREGLGGWIHLILKTILHIMRVIIKAPNNKKERLSIIWQSTKNGFRFDPQIEFVEVR